MQKKRFAYLAVLLMLGSGFALIGVASATTPTSSIQGFTTSYVPYQFTNFTIADINYNFTTTVGSVFLPANNFTGGYFDSLSGNLMKINLETGKYTTLSPLSGFQNAVYNYGNYAMTYYGIMPFYNSSNVLTHISQFALLSNTSKFVFFDYNVLNGTHHTIFTDITNSETQYNVQANYLGNGLFSIIMQNYTLSVFSIYTGKEISHLSLDFFEANNIYWFPQWRVFLNVHAGGSTANDVQTVYVSSTGQIQSNGTSTIYSGSFTDNGVPDAVSYGNQVYFQMQDTATAPNLNVILKYSNGTFSLVRNWLVTPVPVSWITGGYNFGPGNAYVPIQTSSGWLSSTIGGSGINPALTWNPFTNQSANNTNGFPDARTLYDYTANSYNSQGYYLGTGQFALSPYHFAYNGSAYFYYPEMRNGTGAFKLLFGWQYGYSEYISSELTAYTTQTTKYGVYNLSQFGPWNTLYYGQPQPQGGSVPSNVGNVTVGWDNGTLGAPAVYIYSMGHYNWLINNLNLNASSSYYINGSFFGYNQYSAFQVNYNGYLSFQMQYGYAYYNFSNHGTQQQYGKKANYSMFFNRTAETVTVTLTGLSTFVVTDVSSIQSLGLEYGYGQYPTQMVASVPTVTQIIVPIPVPVVYSYRIYETGLVLGSPFSTTSTWSINWNGTMYSSSVNYIEITTTSTSITFLVYGVDGYSVNHRIITVAETGNTTIYSDLNFTQNTNTTPYSIGLLWSYFPYIFTTILVAAIFIPIGLVVRRARRKDR